MQFIGSEKQIKWSEQIHKEALEWVDRNVKILKEDGLPEDFAKDLEEKALALIDQRKEAKWWIDNRKVQTGVPAQYQEEISQDLKNQIPPLRIQVHPQKYDIVWQIRGLRK